MTTSWKPTWKAKNRPLILPGETFGSAVNSPAAGLNTVINDTIPLLALGLATASVRHARGRLEAYSLD